MHVAAFLALLAIAMLMLSALRLELNFRRNFRTRPGPGPQLRIGPAGGYGVLAAGGLHPISRS